MKQKFLMTFVMAMAIANVPIVWVSFARSQHGHHNALQSGTIEGQVLNLEGQPVSRATVYVDKDNSERGSVFTARTDKNGLFTLTGIPPGTYTVYGGKKSDGYPESLAAIYMHAVRYTKVNVNADQVVRGIVLTLGPKLGLLSGMVENLSTKQPVTDVTIRLRLIDNPAYFLETGVDKKGSFKVIAPDTPFMIEVAASGYADWRSIDQEVTQGGSVMQISPGDVRRLVISLQPINK